jgi:sugar diacid utilization regulator
MVADSRPDREGPVREQLSALRSLLVLFMLLSQQDSRASILPFVANAVESLGPARTLGISLDGQWQDLGIPGRAGAPVSLPVLAAEAGGGAVPDGGRLEITGVPWSWAYSLSSPHGPSGYLLVGASSRPAESEQFLLQVLAQQAGVALDNARLRSRERGQAAELRVANLLLERRMDIHERLTMVALRGDGQEGIAEAVYELTGRPAAIEDRFGNLRAWAGPGRPEPYPKDEPDQRDRLLNRMMATAGPVREGERLITVALLGGIPVGVLAVYDPQGTAGDTERIAIEHATTVLTMELARLQGLVETDTRLRLNLVLDLIAGAGPDGDGVLNRAQALGYDLGRPHRVAIVDAPPGEGDIDLFFHAVSRAAQQLRVGSLLAPRLHDVILLADGEPPWDEFRETVAAQVHGGNSRIGVGGRCRETSEYPRSYREAQIALQIQKTIGGPEQVTIFGDLGVYQVLATADDTSAIEQFVHQWLGQLIDYDAVHGTQLVLTLSEYLDHGGSYDASARALSVHRSTLKYRLRRIRDVSGYDLGQPDTQFNLQFAARAWRTLQALRQP